MFSPLVDQVMVSDQCDSRTGSICRFIWHHQASTNDDGTIQMMVSGSREVSATYTVDNTDYEGRGWARITGVIPEDLRPWTSASRTADGRALTVECANSSGDPTWGIAPESVEACARLAAYAYTQYGVPLKRATAADPTGHLGHDEVIGIFGEGYSTACPMNLPIDTIISRAQQLVAGGTEGDRIVQTYHLEDRTTRALAPGQQTFLHDTTSNLDVNVVGGIGPYVITTHVYADGLTPGDALEVALIWENTSNPEPWKHASEHYTQRLIADEHGVIRDSTTFQRGVVAGDMVFVRVTAPTTNAAPAQVSLIDADASLFA